MPSTPRNPILYQNIDQTITIIDIPTSIAHAQGTLSTPHNEVLLSSEPLQEPYQSTEPKSQKARDKLIKTFQHDYDEELDSVYIDLIGSANEDLRQSVIEAWCLPRKISRRGVTRKRKASSMSKEPAVRTGMNENAANNSPPQIGVSAEEAKLSHIFDHITSQKMPPLNISIDNLDNLHSWDGSFHNHEDKPVQLTIQESLFTVPAKSTLLLGDCTRPSELRSMLRAFSTEHHLKRTFDFILLDPPWPNSSVKRKGAYSIVSMLRETKSMLLGMDLDQHVAENALVGMWITNKPAIRELVLGAGGVFEALNVGWIEEWVWLKTTVHGKPVTAIDGLWRKPYEVLLLGRAPGSRLEIARHGESINRRIIFGVPDLHSRKPCLKALIEPFLPEDYQALEIFARYLVSGWWSWGNEVLKFNWHGHWCRVEDECPDAGVVEANPSSRGSIITDESSTVRHEEHTNAE